MKLSYFEVNKIYYIYIYIIALNKKWVSSILELLNKLEEELKMNTYIVNEKLGLELENKKKEVEILTRIANGSFPTQENIDALKKKVS